MTEARKSKALRLAAAQQACADDPMWADHAEVPKKLCEQTAQELLRLDAVEGAYKDLLKEVQALKTVSVCEGCLRTESEIIADGCGSQRCPGMIQPTRQELANKRQERDVHKRLLDLAIADLKNIRQTKTKEN